MPALQGTSSDSAIPGVLGENTTNGGRGVVGNGGVASIGVLGQNDTGDAVFGNSRLGRVWLGRVPQTLPRVWADLKTNRTLRLVQVCSVLALRGSGSMDIALSKLA